MKVTVISIQYQLKLCPKIFLEQCSVGGVSGSLSGWLVGGGGWGGGVMFPGPVMSLEYCKSYHLVTSTRQLGAAGFDHLKRVEPPPPHTHTSNSVKFVVLIIIASFLHVKFVILITVNMVRC